MKKILSVLLALLGMSSCLTLKQSKVIETKDIVIPISDQGDYIRPIKNAGSYYYNSPKDGKIQIIKK